MVVLCRAVTCRCPCSVQGREEVGGPAKTRWRNERLGEGVKDVRMPRPWFILGEARFTVYCVVLCVYDVILLIL